MATTFYLVRHGVKEKIAGDAPLSAKGITQAKETALFLQPKPITAVYTSPLRRAKETAAPIAAVHRCVIAEDSRLRERANWGDLPGQTFEEFAAMWERCTMDPEYAPPVGDSAKQAGERLRAFLLDAARRHPGSEIAVVTHGGLLTDFMLQALQPQQLAALHPEFASVQTELISECSITTLIYDENGFQVASFATVNHLSTSKGAR